MVKMSFRKKARKKITLFMLILFSVFVPHLSFAELDGEDDGFADSFYDSGDYDFYSGNYSDDDDGENANDDSGDGGNTYVSYYEDAKTALEEALECERNVDAIEYEQLLEDYENAKTELDNYCAEHGYSYSEDPYTGALSFFDEDNNPVTSIGDPVLLASGVFQIDDCDLTVTAGKTCFAVHRHFCGDGISDEHSFGSGWASIFDSRIILGCSPKMESECAKWDELVSKGEEYAALIAEYAADDSDCIEIQEQMDATLAEWILERDKMHRFAEESVANAKKNQYAAYGYAGTFADKIGCGRLIFVSDYGNALIMEETEANDGEYQNARYGNKIVVTKNVDSYTVRFRSGETRTYNEYGLLHSISFRNGGKIILTHDAQQKIASVGVNNVQTLRLTWTGNRISSVSDGTRTVSYTYSGGSLKSVKDADGDVRSFAYDEKGRITRQIKSDGSYVAFGYEKCADGKERAVYTINENGAKEQFSYDVENHRTTYTDHDGVKSVYQYDSENRTVKETYADGKEISYSYDSDGNLSVRESLGKRESYRYDADGHLLAVTYGDGSIMRQEYSGNNLISYSDRDGVTTDMNYDSRGNCIAIYRGGKKIWTYTYNALNLTETATDCRGNRAEFTYDGRGHLTQKQIFAAGTDSPVSEETWVRDACGRMTKYVDATGVTHFYRYEPHAFFVSADNGFEAELRYSNRKDLVLSRAKDTVTGEERIFRYEYDKCHHLTKILLSGTDGAGKKYEEMPLESSAYTEHGRLAQKIIWNGKDSGWSTRADFDGAGNVSRLINGFVDASGNPVGTNFDVLFQRERTTDGFLLSETNADGRKIERLYDDAARLLETREKDALVRQRQYSAGGRLVKSKTAFGGFLEFSYDDDTGYFAGQKEIGGTMEETVASWYADGKKSVATNPKGHKIFYYYNAFGNLAKKADDGRIEEWQYDSAQRLLRHTVTSASGDLVFEEDFSYGADNRSVTHTKGGRFKTVYRRNVFGEIISVADGDGNARHFVYDIRGRCIEETNPYGKKKQFFYNGKNQLTKEIECDGNATTYEYDFNGNCTKISDERGTVFSASYDKSNRILTKTKFPVAATERYEYDAFDRITKLTQGDAVVLQTVFSGKNFSRIDGNGKASEYVTDGFGRFLSEKNRSGKTQTYTYAADGSLQKATDFEGNLVHYGYDTDAHRISVFYADGSFAVEERDAAGNLICVRNQTNCIQFSYDTAGNLLSQYDVNSKEKTEYTYDDCGRKIRIQNEKQDIRYQYGKNGEVTKVADERNGMSVRFVYDDRGNETLRSYSSGESVRFKYDKAGRLVLTVGYNPKMAVTFVDGAVYDERGFRTLTLNNDFSVTRYTYDNNGRLASVSYPYSGKKAAYLQKLCAAAGVGYKTAPASVHLLSVIEYNALKMLCAVIGAGFFQPSILGATLEERFFYDKNGNLSRRETPFGTIKYAYDADDRLVLWGEYGQAQYDANGNLLQKKDLYNEERYAYTLNQRLKNLEVRNKISSEFMAYAFTYDALGRRVTSASSAAGTMRTVYEGTCFSELYTVRDSFEMKQDDTSATGVRYRFLSDENLDSARTASEKTSVGEIIAGLFHTVDYGHVALYGNGHAPLAVAKFSADDSVASSEKYALFSDSAGTVKAARKSNGLEYQFDYDVFGAKISSDDSGLPYGFAGKKSLSATALYDFGYRDYSPAYGRFVSPDPARDGQNWYAYCNGDPVNFVDTLGLENMRIDDVDMHDSRWSDEKLGYSQTNTLGKEGCTVSGIAEVINAVTGSSLTPMDVNNEKTNFEKDTDRINFVSVAKNYGVVHDYWTAANQHGLENKVEELNNSSTQYAILAQVQYGTDKDDLHWVGLNGGVIDIQGHSYVCVSQTSAYDNVAQNSMRSDAGWVKGADGNVYVPIENVNRLETFSTGYRGDLWYATGNQDGRQSVELADGFKITDDNQSVKNQ